MSKVFTAEQLASCRVVQLPEVGPVRRHTADTRGQITVDELQAIHKQAHDEGFAQGRREGYAAGRDEAARHARRLAELLADLNTPLQDLDDEVVNQVAQLAIALARHMVRRELKTEPGQVVAIIREAVASLPAAARNVRLQLHPEDARLVREALALEEQGSGGWRIEEVPTMTRGGCTVLTDTSRVDATVEHRFAALVAQLMGGEREHDGDAR